MPRLPALLTTDDLPLAELTALRCDGVLVAIGSCYTAIDHPDTPTTRARSAAHGLHERMIAERMTAAWIWGARHTAPTPHQFCTDLAARVTHRILPWLELREVVLGPRDTAVVGDIVLTTPLRTIADIARFERRWGEEEGLVVDRLRDIGDVGASAIADELARVNLPHKRRAQHRLGLSPS